MKQKYIFLLLIFTHVFTFGIGYVVDLPNNITFSADEELRNMTEKFSLSMKNLSVDYENCPECNCECEQAICEKQICNDKKLLENINNNIKVLQNKEAPASSVYFVEEYVDNCTTERAITKIQASVERTEKVVSDIKINDEKVQKEIKDDIKEIEQHLENLY